jgi:hypothetical protein
VVGGGGVVVELGFALCACLESPSYNRSVCRQGDCMGAGPAVYALQEEEPQRRVRSAEDQ